MTEVAATYRSVFAVGEFRTLFGTQLLSVIGDQLARVALSVLVFERTGSPALTAVTYALTFVPELVGGPLLGGLADRMERRRLMVVCDVIRAGLVAAMAVPGMPFWSLCALLVGVQLAGAPYKAARITVLRVILPGERFPVGSGLMDTMFQLSLLGGYSAGAPLVATVGSGHALLADAVTFAVSATVIALSMRQHLPSERAARVTTLESLRAGSSLVWRNRQLRLLLLIACLAGFYAVPPGLAVPYAEQIGEGTAAIGILLAADPLGSALGAVLLTRLVPPKVRLRLLGPLAVATSALLVPTVLAPGLWITATFWLLSGLFSGHDSVTKAAFQDATPEHQRGQAFALASAALRAAQGFGIALAGAVAEVTTPAIAIALFASAGVVAGLGAALAWRRTGLTADSAQ